MQASAAPDGSWSHGDRYDNYVGRWSRLLAAQFLQWLSVPPQSAWLDVGCGTGALSRVILESAEPESIRLVDRSPEYLDFARSRLADLRLSFEVGDAQDLPVESGAYDAVVSGLVLNFVDDHARMVAEMKRAARPGGVVALYVWDYAGKMQLMRHFWNAAAALDPEARQLDEGLRFPICNPGALARLFEQAGLHDVEAAALNIDTGFKNFDDYWDPFLGGQGPASAYALSLSEEQRTALRESLRTSLPTALDGSIPLVARAWAVRGTA